jgi:hypothetical protein
VATCHVLANIGFSLWILLPVLAGLEFEQALRDTSVDTMGLDLGDAFRAESQRAPRSCRADRV